MKKALLFVIILLSGISLKAGFNVSLSGNFAAPFSQTILLEYSPGIQIAAGYCFNKNLEIELQGQKMWFMGGALSTYNSYGIAFTAFPVRGYLSPYLSMGLGLGELNDEVYIYKVKIPLIIFRPQLGVELPAGFGNNLFMDLGLSYEHLKYRDHDGELQLWKIKVGAIYRF